MQPIYKYMTSFFGNILNFYLIFYIIIIIILLVIGILLFKKLLQFLWI
jgi:hypothetical protein